jgi:hypothetical protein
LGAVFSQLAMLINAQFKSAEQVYDVFGTKVIAALAQAAMPIHLVQMAHLELGAIGTGFTSFIDHHDGTVEATVVVIADLGDDEGATSADFVVSDFYLQLL